MFRKDVLLDEENWEEPSMWYPSIYDPARMPSELACHTFVNNARYVVKLREPAQPSLVDEEHMRYRVYTEWCPHGTLEGIIERYKNKDKMIPEPFIWSVAESLVYAGMDIGNILNFGGIVHR